MSGPSLSAVLRAVRERLLGDGVRGTAVCLDLERLSQMDQLAEHASSSSSSSSSPSASSLSSSTSLMLVDSPLRSHGVSAVKATTKFVEQLRALCGELGARILIVRPKRRPKADTESKISFVESLLRSSQAFDKLCGFPDHSPFQRSHELLVLDVSRDGQTHSYAEVVRQRLRARTDLYCRAELELGLEPITTGSIPARRVVRSEHTPASEAARANVIDLTNDETPRELEQRRAKEADTRVKLIALERTTGHRISLPSSSADGLSPAHALFIGAEESAKNVEWLEEAKISLVVCLTPIPVTAATRGDSLRMIRLPLNDSVNERVLQNPNFMDVLGEIRTCLVNDGNVLVHCREGRSRSAMICIAYLMKFHELGYSAAFDQVNGCRQATKLRLNSGFVHQLESLSDPVPQRGSGSRSARSSTVTQAPPASIPACMPPLHLSPRQLTSRGSASFELMPHGHRRQMCIDQLTCIALFISPSTADSEKLQAIALRTCELSRELEGLQEANVRLHRKIISCSMSNFNTNGGGDNCETGDFGDDGDGSKGVVSYHDAVSHLGQGQRALSNASASDQEEVFDSYELEETLVPEFSYEREETVAFGEQEQLYLTTIDGDDQFSTVGPVVEERLELFRDEGRREHQEDQQFREKQCLVLESIDMAKENAELVEAFERERAWRAQARHQTRESSPFVPSSPSSPPLASSFEALTCDSEFPTTQPYASPSRRAAPVDCCEQQTQHTANHSSTENGTPPIDRTADHTTDGTISHELRSPVLPLLSSHRDITPRSRRPQELLHFDRTQNAQRRYGITLLQRRAQRAANSQRRKDERVAAARRLVAGIKK